MKKHNVIIHPSTPRKLAKAFILAGSFRALENILGVNRSYLWKMIVMGIQPVNPDVRERMFLPKKPRRPRAETGPRFPLPKHLVWWRKIGRERRDEIIMAVYIKEWFTKMEKEMENEQ